MTHNSRLARVMRRFLHREEGSILIETILTLPVLWWAAFSLFVFWDGFQTVNSLQKATYTIGDILSRNRNNIDSTDAEGMSDLLDFLTSGPEAPRLRMTSIQYDAEAEEYAVLWSCSLAASALPPLNTATLQDMADRLPINADGATLLVVQTEQDFRPVLKLGIDAMTMREEVIVRPRFVSVLGFTDPANCT